MALKDAFPDLLLISLKKNAIVTECWNVEQNYWNLDFRRGIPDREFVSRLGLISTIDTVRVGDGVDKAS